MEIVGKVAVVTGAGGGGSGRAIAQALANAGASVIVSDVNEKGGIETVQMIQATRGQARFWLADVRNEADVKALMAFTETTFGGVDILVNNASGPGFHPEAPLEYWFETVQTDLLGTMYGTRYAIDAMRKRGGGTIVNMGSTSALAHGRMHSGGSPAYDVAKIGTIRLTTMLAWLKAKDNIRVNCLVPDWIASPDVRMYFDSLPPNLRGKDGVPEVLTTLEEIADAVVRLVENEALAGRVLVWWSGKAPKFVAFGDPGYVEVENCDS